MKYRHKETGEIIDLNNYHELQEELERYEFIPAIIVLLGFLYLIYCVIVFNPIID